MASRGRSAKKKGSDAEREVAKILRKKGIPAKRMLLSGGGYLKGDIYANVPWSFEIKRQEKMNFWPWWEQAVADAGMSKNPVVVYRPNHRPWIAMIRLEDFADLLVENIQLNEQIRELTVDKPDNAVGGSHRTDNLEYEALED